ncbi:MAG: RluA family pseudouridine synthase [Treponemataceae bacterium]|nr:RluA family pseudouridine synthase [Treponemataceae bacterium]
MDFVNFTASENDAERRIDRIILKMVPQMNISIVCANLRSGFIRLNGKKCKNSERVSCGDTLSIEKHLYERFAGTTTQAGGKNAASATTQAGGSTKTAHTTNASGTDFDLGKRTLFRNEHILILNKPRGMLVQKANKNDISLDQIVENDYRQTFGSSSLSFKTGPMHRLDKGTSGIICFSQSLKCARWFQQAMLSHQFKKTYIAICKGKLDEKEKWVDNISNDFSKNEGGFYTGKISCDEDNSKAAITYARPLAYGKDGNVDLTLVEFVIETGRHHQIRLQSSEHGYPLYADSAYSKSNADGFYLHCIKLEIGENEFSIPETIYCKPSMEFQNAMKNFLIKYNVEDYNILS